MEAAFRIRDFFKDIASFDIHNENIMVKVDEQGSPIELVITDPVSYTCDNKAVEELMTQVLQTQEKEHKNIEPTKTKLSTKLLPTRFLPTTKLLPNKLDIKPDVLKEFLNQVDKPRIHEMAWDCLRIKPLPPEVIKVFHGEQTIQLPKIKLKSNIA